MTADNKIMNLMLFISWAKIHSVVKNLGFLSLGFYTKTSCKIINEIQI